MNMAYVREHYKVPAKRGMRVAICYYDEVPEITGTILSAGSGLYLRTDDGRRLGPFHPTWGVMYYDKEGKLVCDCRYSPPRLV